MALLQLTVIPLGTGNPSVGEYVADVQKALEKENIRFQLNDMGTLIEGEAQELLGVVSRIYELPFLKGAQRVVTQMVIDDRRDKDIQIGDKIDAVQSRLKLSEKEET
ncbi:MAG: MTH1187 family thiamine-binding protein [Desulfobulbaceae bacterium]|nr:MTH1187 family thiamine-binding protein [Desulfobulbaceae bacterium]